MNKKLLIGISVLIIIISGYFILNTLLFNGIKPKSINQDGFQANLYTTDSIKNNPAIVLVGGGEWGDYWSQEFAKRGYTVLSLPYYRQEGLRELMEEIPLEYFEKAINWLKEQPNVDPDKIIVMGASRNAELSLVIASTFPESVHGVIAYAPSAVSWSNTVMPFNSNAIKPSWTYRGEAIPYIGMEKIAAPESTSINTLKYWEQGLAQNEKVNNAMIPVEKITGPVLLLSGRDDKIWPSSKMADMIAERLKENNFEYEFQNIQYDNAGHLISSNSDAASSQHKGQMTIDGKSYEFYYGGTVDGDLNAQTDSKEKIFDFLKKL